MRSHLACEAREVNKPKNIGSSVARTESVKNQSVDCV